MHNYAKQHQQHHINIKCSKQQQIASGNIPKYIHNWLLSALVTKKAGKHMPYITNHTSLTVYVCKQQQIASGNIFLRVLICSAHPKKGRRQVNEKSFDLKREYRDGIKRRETRQGYRDGWMDIVVVIN